MRIKEVIQLLEKSFPKGRQVLLVGPPGGGKTAAVNVATRTINYDLITTHPAIADPTTYQGYPYKADDGTHAKFLPFGELYRAIHAVKPTVFFLDDLGQSPESVQKALMQLIHGRRLNGHVLPDHVTFVAATNDVKQMSGVTGIIEPVKSRWDSIIKVESNLEDWCDWANSAMVHPYVIAFLRSSPGDLHEFVPTKELKNSPCPRTWESVSKWLTDGVDDFEVLAGAVGEGPATKFRAFIELANEAPNLDAILLNPAQSPIPDRPSLLYLVAGGLARRMNKGNIGQAMTYLNRLSQPFRVLSLKDATRMNSELTKTSEFISWALKEGKELL